MNISIPTFKAFNNFNYCLIWVSTTLMICSHQMVALAQSYWIYDNTGSATILGVVGIAAAIPLLLIAPIGGAVADRFNQKKLMIMCQTLQMSFAWAVVILLVMDLMVWQHLLVIGLGYGIIWATNGPARQALLPKILDKSVLPNGIALITAGMSIAGLIAPAIAGVLYAKYSPEFVFFVSSMLSVISLVIALFIRMPKSKAEVKGTKITSDAIDGLKYLWSDFPTRTVLIIGMVFFFMESPVHSLLSVLVVDVYKLESEGLGLLAAMLGVGGLVGNVFIATMPPKKKRVDIYISSIFIRLCINGSVIDTGIYGRSDYFNFPRVCGWWTIPNDADSYVEKHGPEILWKNNEYNYDVFWLYASCCSSSWDSFRYIGYKNHYNNFRRWVVD